MGSATVAIFCVYLQFGFAKASYIKICGICDKKVHDIVEPLVLKKYHENVVSYYSIEFAPTLHGNDNELYPIIEVPHQEETEQDDDIDIENIFDEAKKKKIFDTAGCLI